VSDFFGLRIALSSLYAQRRALDVTGHNIANANTQGYSRQRVGLTSDAGPVTPAVHARWVGTGQGVRAASVDRLRDEFLESRGHQEHATEANLRRTQSTLARVELAFAEPSDNGIAAQLADFWAGWDDVANRPDDMAARVQLVERASTLASTFTGIDSALAALAAASAEQLGATVTEVNATAERIAELNGTILSTVNAGFAANDLMDQRDVLVGELAELVGASARRGEDGQVDVFVGGSAVVRGTRAEALTIRENPTRVVWAKDGTTAVVGGDTAGLLESVNDTLPGYRGQLAAVAGRLREDVNARHLGGAGLDGTAGRRFFTLPPAALAVHPDVVADPAKVGAAAPGGGQLDGSVAAAMAELDAPDAQYRELIVALGVGAQTVNRRVDIQAAITTQVDAAREAEAGVNLDEEMVNMVSFQHAYQAAARFMTAVDQTLDTLINGTGRVGR
jgi:flagellar hook-associated protein 1